MANNDMATGWEFDDEAQAKTKKGAPGSGGNKYSSHSISEYWLQMPQEIGDEIRIRFVGAPRKYYRHDNKIWDAEAKATVVTEFPDQDDENLKRNRYHRKCSDPRTNKEVRPSRATSKCGYCRMGYTRSPRWMANVIDRADGGLKIADISPTTFTQISEWWEKRQNTYPNGIGDTEGSVPDFIITRASTTQYTVAAATKVDSEGNETVARFSLSENDLEAIAKWNPDAKTEADRYLLHDLEHFTRPQQLPEKLQEKLFGEVFSPWERRTAGPADAPKEDFESESEDDVVGGNDEPSTPVPPKKVPGSAATVTTSDSDDDEDLAW